jgi:RND family efflux transporter MFP subunit
MHVARGAAVFRLVPRTRDRSLLELNADATALEAEADAARKRVERLTELVRVEASSPAELERARASLAGIEARLAAARRGADVADGGSLSSDRSLEVRAPWAGRVAEVSVSPGQSVAAGTVLGRLVKPSPLWLEVALRPEVTPRLKGGLFGVNVRRASVPEPLQFARGEVRLVAVAPQVDPQTAALATTIQVQADASDLPIGTAVEAEILLDGERRGVVIPHSALVDDAGVTVAYVQDSGETFSRREVGVIARQGTQALVTGLQPGDRLATRGGAAIRRSSLLSSGAPEGHVH